ncbi:hypothetical protein TDE_0203 [Treponema denticola ATCC 35405]|uniref:Uncharacterized protein n=1 Tax=Treponema denticola (strain ATCC 35405 / DSM 14222 / CIP 103919 / JCM 8153 / KCTC 15104) TaxID=243275 RepID=Q73R88_TREDE|nr:hypothetical protein TDE_0203 [Treponema denticola ATCC 35405]
MIGIFFTHKADGNKGSHLGGIEVTGIFCFISPDSEKTAETQNKKNISLTANLIREVFISTCIGLKKISFNLALHLRLKKCIIGPLINLTLSITVRRFCNYAS